MKEWVKELTNRTEPEDKILEHMAYLVHQNRRPNLMDLCRSLESGLPRGWKDRRTMQETADDGVYYFGLVVEAMDSPDHWGELAKCIEMGKQKAPLADWSEVERECEMRRKKSPGD